jgi:hypothetical protein
MHRRTSRDAHPDSGDLALEALVVCCQPDARAATDPTGVQAVLGERCDQGLFEPSYVIDDKYRFG